MSETFFFYSELLEDIKDLLREVYCSHCTYYCLSLTCKEEFTKSKEKWIYWRARGEDLPLNSLSGITTFLERAPLQARCDFGLRLVREDKKGLLAYFEQYFHDPNAPRCHHINIFAPLVRAIYKKKYELGSFLIELHTPDTEGPRQYCICNPLYPRSEPRVRNYRCMAIRPSNENAGLRYDPNCDICQLLELERAEGIRKEMKALFKAMKVRKQTNDTVT